MQKDSHDDNKQAKEPAKSPGRPRLSTQDCAMDNYNARISAWHARAARRLGEGNLSAGIRLAIEIAITNMT